MRARAPGIFASFTWHLAVLSGYFPHCSFLSDATQHARGHRPRIIKSCARSDPPRPTGAGHVTSAERRRLLLGGVAGPGPRPFSSPAVAVVAIAGDEMPSLERF